MSREDAVRPELSFSAATEADLDEVMRLEHSGFLPGIIERPDVFLERIRVFPEGFLVARTGPEQRAIGYICSEIWPYRDPIDASMFELNHGIAATHREDGDELYVSSMTILPSLRGQGLGRRLFAECIERARSTHSGIFSVLLIVNETWGNARKIYMTEGFIERFRIKGFFTPSDCAPQDAIVMRRGLACTTQQTTCK